MRHWLGFIVVVANVALFPHVLRADKPKEYMATDTTAFATDLFSQLATEKGNRFFSPTSIETALAMTFAGARGTTAEQMAKSLHFTGNADEVSAIFGTLLKTLNNPPEVISSFDDKGKPGLMNMRCFSHCFGYTSRR